MLTYELESQNFLFLMYKNCSEGSQSRIWETWILVWVLPLHYTLFVFWIIFHQWGHFWCEGAGKWRGVLLHGMSRSRTVLKWQFKIHMKTPKFIYVKTANSWFSLYLHVGVNFHCPRILLCSFQHHCSVLWFESPVPFKEILNTILLIFLW